MMGRLNKFLTRNVFWKLFSIIAAIVLWFVVMNIENPNEIRVFQTTLTLANLESLDKQNLTLINQSALEKIDITMRIKGTRMALDKLHSFRKNIRATVNFDVLYGFDQTSPLSVPVNITLPSIGENLEIIERNPPHVDVHTEKITVTQKNVTAVVSGNVADGYSALLPVVEPNTIDVRGPQSLLDTIDSVRIYVDVNDASDDVEISSEPKIYNENEVEILGLTKNISEVKVVVPINKYSNVPIRITNQGVPAEGYTLTGISYEPKTIEIVGKDKDIGNISEITLPVINIQDLSASYEDTIDIRTLLPANISIKNGTPNQVTIKVTIKKLLVKELLIPVDDINIEGAAENIEYLIPNGSTLIIRGIEENIVNVTESDISVSVDVTGLTSGVHELPLKLSMPKEATLLGDLPKVSVEVIEEIDIVDALTDELEDSLEDDLLQEESAENEGAESENNENESEDNENNNQENQENEDTENISDDSSL